MQQQQLISMLQNQQTQQRSEEESKIQLLQLQISQQQKLIEGIREQKVQNCYVHLRIYCSTMFSMMEWIDTIR